MIVGIPKEVKDNEYRVAITPGGVRQLVEAGHTVLVEAGAGTGSGFSDEAYENVGARLVPEAADAWGAELVAKVKEPQPVEYPLMRPGLNLFTYLHLAPAKSLTLELVKRRVTAIAYETVEKPDGSLPLLTPMSEVAGRMAIQVGVRYLEKPFLGRGILLGGVPGVPPANVTIIGAGVVGTNAAQMALGMGANVTILDIDLDRLRHIEEILHGRLNSSWANSLNIANTVKSTDLLIGAVLIKGARAPRLVTRAMILTMVPGSVVVDVSVDQGGCIETTRPCTHSDPICIVEGIVHYGVTNMPGAVPRTSTYALSNATLPYLMKLVDQGIPEALRCDPALAKGVNAYDGKITYRAVAENLELEYTPLESLIQGLK
jgi:alanine dehydrogenase